MSIEQEASEGHRAEILMHDMQPYFNKVRDAIIAKWEASPVADVEGQHELRLMRKLLADLEVNIKTVIDTGKLAQVQIERESKLDKAKRFVRRVI